MSNALRYVGAVRPEAATHLFGFYKQSVQALDEKTKFLIQIVTKTVVGTERGLRQYAPKALKAGATKEEILDAVMMAFPASGLNRMLDAIDILNDMDLLPSVPSAPPAKENRDQDFTEKNLGPVQQFPERKMYALHRPDGEDLIVFRTGAETVHLYSARCPHAKANLCRGVNHGDRVECKVHNWMFDLETGRCLEPDPEGKPGLRRVPAMVRDGNVICGTD